MSEWQPIETVPEYGLFLVYEDGAMRTMLREDGEWKHVAMPLIKNAFGDTLYVSREYAAAHPGHTLEISDCIYEPTHWMHLPEPPKP